MDRPTHAQRRACPEKIQSYIERLEKRLAKQSRDHENRSKIDASRIAMLAHQNQQSAKRFSDIAESMATRIEQVEARNVRLVASLDGDTRPLFKWWRRKRKGDS